MQSLKISLYEILLSLANAQDLALPEITLHHQQVANLALRIAQEAGLSLADQKEIYIAALVHDVGALSMRERFELIEGTAFNMYTHAVRGAKLLETFEPLKRVAELIRYHHTPWNKGRGAEDNGRKIEMGSHIIHLADRICIKLKPGKNILSQVPDLLAYLQEQSNKQFIPELVELVLNVGRKEDFWLDITNRLPGQEYYQSNMRDYYFMSIEDLVQLSKIFSHIIDFRSKFTAKHSAGVAKTAERLAELVGFSPMECRMMLVAGYLHDLGKLAISDEVLEKPAKLTIDEYNEIRAHTYYTYRLLEPIAEMKTINEWAAFHHEKLNGKGYPFHLAGNDIPLGARVMAVADVFTAVTESRPYRKSMPKEEIISVFENMVKSNGLDGRIVAILLENFDELHTLCLVEQEKAGQEYEEFLANT